jgi:hypothetical protein
MAKIKQCDSATNAAFNRLVAVIGTEEYKQMKRLRNAITFHYETQAIQDAINRQSAMFPDYARIVDGVIIRHPLAMTSDPAVSAKVDKVAGRLQEIAEDLANFAGYFVPKYCTCS